VLIGLGGKTPGTEFDQLIVNNTASLGGKIEVELQNGYLPQIGDTFLILPPSLFEVGNFAEVVGAPPGLAFRTTPTLQGVQLETTLPLPANTSSPRIDGAPEPGQTLTCNPGSWTTNPTFAFQWLRNGNAVAGATRAEYAVTEDDVGLVLVCHVTATNEGGSADAESDAVRAREPAAPETPAATPATTPTPAKPAAKPATTKKKLGKRQVCSKMGGQKVCLTGPAALRSPACLKIKKAKYKFVVSTSKKKVKVLSVKFRLDKKSAGTRTKKPFGATLNGAKLKKGRHRVVADGRYVVKKKTLRKKLTLSWKTC
jgi:hypothetical protein